MNNIAWMLLSPPMLGMLVYLLVMQITENITSVRLGHKESRTSSRRK